MKYNFDLLIDRRNTGAIKWDVKENELPMWVADMDFKSCPEVTESLQKTIDLGVYGYFDVTDEWYDSIINWYKNYHNLEYKKEGLIFTTGVIAALSSIVRRLTHPNENVCLLTPVYNTFYNSIINNGTKPIESNMRKNSDGTYSIDFEDLEDKLENKLTTLMILCNPHNPTGNIWSKEDITNVCKLCKKHGVILISDEVHSELLDPGYEYVPLMATCQEAKEIGIVLNSTSKTFNVAGLHGAFVYSENKILKDRIERGFNNDEVAEPNAFIINAMVAAYSKGRPWLDELREYLYENKKYTYEFIEREIPSLKVTKSHATYLLWIDITNLNMASNEFISYLRKEVGLIVSSGEIYHGDGKDYFRLNVACPKSRLIDGLNRLKEAVNKL